MIQKRSIPVYIILSIVTCGIFNMYWFVCLTDDTNFLAKRDGDTSGILALVLTIVTCNIYGLYWAYMMGDKIDDAKNQRGIPSSNSGILFLILSLFGFGFIANAILQSEINKIVDVDDANGTAY